MPLLNLLGHNFERTRSVFKQCLFLRAGHQAEQIARLLEVVFVQAMIPMPGSAGNLQRRFTKVRLVGPGALAVGHVRQLFGVVAVHAHGAVAVEAVHRATGGVDRDLVVIDPQAIARGIAVGKQARLQHAVR
ncbi:hypothetical protein D3C76_1324960 [compost metagenome]